MSEKLFNKIIGDLKEINYSNIVSLFLNNDPFIDKRMPEMLSTVRKNLPKAKVLMLTNGISLTNDKLDLVSENIDTLLINNYNDTYKLTESSKRIYNHVINNSDRFNNIEIIIEKRYAKEVISNRAGASPNYPSENKIIHETCLLPLTDLTIFPDGTVGLCCNDALERTNFGDLNTDSIKEIISDKKYLSVKKLISRDRSEFDFCKYCNFTEAGMRLNYINAKKLQSKYRTGKQ